MSMNCCNYSSTSLVPNQIPVMNDAIISIARQVYGFLRPAYANLSDLKGTVTKLSERKGTVTRFSEPEGALSSPPLATNRKQRD